MRLVCMFVCLPVCKCTSNLAYRQLGKIFSASDFQAPGSNPSRVRMMKKITCWPIAQNCYCRVHGSTCVKGLQSVPLGVRTVEKVTCWLVDKNIASFN